MRGFVALALISVAILLCLPPSVTASDEKVYALFFTECPVCRLRHLPEIIQFVYHEAHMFPRLSVSFFGGLPRIKFVKSADGPPRAYMHLIKERQNLELEDFVHVDNMTAAQIRQVLVERGVEIDPNASS